MIHSFLRYKPQAGYIHNWLVAGPQIVTVGITTRQLDGAPNADRQELAAHFEQPEVDMKDTPCENAKFTLPGPSESAVQFVWRYRRCEDDHLVDLASDAAGRHFLRAWAYTEIVSPVAQRLAFTLDTFGPTQIWLNDQRVMRQENVAAESLHTVKSEVNFVKGANRILVRFEQVSNGPSPFAFALKVGGVDPLPLQVRIPTLNAKVKKHYAIEQLAQRAYIDRDLYAGPEVLYIKWPTTIRTKGPLMLRVQKPSGQVVGDAQPIVSAGLSQHLLEGNWAKDGRYQVKVLPELEEHARGMRVGQDIDVNILHGTYVDEPQGDLSTRAIEFLEHTAWWTEGLFAEMASMTLGHWKQVNQKEILRLMDQTLARQGHCEETLVGLLLMAHRFATDSSMPPLLAQRLEECLLGFDYEAAPEPNNSVGEVGLAEEVAILCHACSVLVGQLYADRLFVHSHQPGRWHRQLGEQRALAWLKRRAQGGFAAWDSGEGFVAMLLGLVALADYAESESLAELAAAHLDKVLFSLALNSFQGVFGSTHGATSAASITDARMEPTSPISRLLWGIGCWNQHTAACFALATSQTYGATPLHEAIALDRPAALWSRERHICAWRDAAAGLKVRQEVNKVTFKTPDYMLSSAQDYYAGEAGSREHIWQATLSPSAVVFVNHPRFINLKDAYPANFWRGNGVLPRVAQWRDLLVAIHRLPSDDWLGYTHAHFPVAAFDQVTFRRGWAFARKGDGYLALSASQGMKLVKRGPGAYRELRSVGLQNVWICQMGRAAQDGSFAEFQKAILTHPVTFDDLGLSFVSLRGDAIAFDWAGPLLVQGSAQPLNGFPHYESPYSICELGASEMDIHFADSVLRLSLETSNEMSGDVLEEVLGDKSPTLVQE